MVTGCCSSTIIEDVFLHCRTNPSAAIAYFYFDFNDEQKQGHNNLICSLVVQFMDQLAFIPGALSTFYSKKNTGQGRPRTDDLTGILKTILGEFQHAYIVLDALDECRDREKLLTFIEETVNWKLGNIHFLATSRKERDINDCLTSLVTTEVTISSTDVDMDIQCYVRERLAKDPKLSKWPTKVREEISLSLMSGAHGTYNILFLRPWTDADMVSQVPMGFLSARNLAETSETRPSEEGFGVFAEDLGRHLRANPLKYRGRLCCRCLESSAVACFFSTSGHARRGRGDDSSRIRCQRAPTVRP